MGSESFHFDISGQGLGVLLGPTEAKLMDLAWDRPSLTVKSAIIRLGRDKALAYTTVMTVLNRLVEKRLLTRTREGRNFVYRAGVDHETFVTERVNRILDCLRKNFPDAAESFNP